MLRGSVMHVLITSDRQGSVTVKTPDIPGLIKTESQHGVTRYHLKKGEWVSVYRYSVALFRDHSGDSVGRHVAEVNHQGTTDSIESAVKLLLGVR